MAEPSNAITGDAESEEAEGPFRWDMEAFRASMRPATRRNFDRHLQYVDAQRRFVWRLFPWTRWPLLAYVYAFWSLLMDEGIRSTLKPRWGAITFSFLNDGIKPTVWHTWKQVMDPYGPYDAIWPHGAPRNKAEADRDP